MKFSRFSVKLLLSFASVVMFFGCDALSNPIKNDFSVKPPKPASLDDLMLVSHKLDIIDQYGVESYLVGGTVIDKEVYVGTVEDPIPDPETGLARAMGFRKINIKVTVDQDALAPGGISTAGFLAGGENGVLRLYTEFKGGSKVAVIPDAVFYNQPTTSGADLTGWRNDIWNPILDQYPVIPQEDLIDGRTYPPRMGGIQEAFLQIMPSGNTSMGNAVMTAQWMMKRQEVTDFTSTAFAPLSPAAGSPEDDAAHISAEFRKGFNFNAREYIPYGQTAPEIAMLKKNQYIDLKLGAGVVPTQGVDPTALNTMRAFLFYAVSDQGIMAQISLKIEVVKFENFKVKNNDPALPAFPSTFQEAMDLARNSRGANIWVAKNYSGGPNPRTSTLPAVTESAAGFISVPMKIIGGFIGDENANTRSYAGDGAYTGGIDDYPTSADGQRGLYTTSKISEALTINEATVTLEDIDLDVSTSVTITGGGQLILKNARLITPIVNITDGYLTIEDSGIGTRSMVTATNPPNIYSGSSPAAAGTTVTVGAIGATPYLGRLDLNHGIIEGKIIVTGRGTLNLANVPTLGDTTESKIIAADNTRAGIGVDILPDGKFVIDPTGGTISGFDGSGGIGVNIQRTNTVAGAYDFNMKGGTITGNNIGLKIGNFGYFNKSGGIISSGMGAYANSAAVHDGTLEGAVTIPYPSVPSYIPPSAPGAVDDYMKWTSAFAAANNFTTGPITQRALVVYDSAVNGKAHTDSGRSSVVLKLTDAKFTEAMTSPPPAAGSSITGTPNTYFAFYGANKQHFDSVTQANTKIMTTADRVIFNFGSSGGVTAQTDDNVIIVKNAKFTITGPSPSAKLLKATGEVDITSIDYADDNLTITLGSADWAPIEEIRTYLSGGTTALGAVNVTTGPSLNTLFHIRTVNPINNGKGIKLDGLAATSVPTGEAISFAGANTTLFITGINPSVAVDLVNGDQKLWVDPIALSDNTSGSTTLSSAVSGNGGVALIEPILVNGSQGEVDTTTTDNTDAKGFDNGKVYLAYTLGKWYTINNTAVSTWVYRASLQDAVIASVAFGGTNIITGLTPGQAYDIYEVITPAASTTPVGDTTRSTILNVSGIASTYFPHRITSGANLKSGVKILLYTGATAATGAGSLPKDRELNGTDIASVQLSAANTYRIGNQVQAYKLTSSRVDPGDDLRGQPTISAYTSDTWTTIEKLTAVGTTLGITITPNVKIDPTSQGIASLDSVLGLTVSNKYFIKYTASGGGITYFPVHSGVRQNGYSALSGGNPMSIIAASQNGAASTIAATPDGIADGSAGITGTADVAGSYSIYELHQVNASVNPVPGTSFGGLAVDNIPAATNDAIVPLTGNRNVAVNYVGLAPLNPADGLFGFKLEMDSTAPQIYGFPAEVLVRLPSGITTAHASGVALTTGEYEDTLAASANIAFNDIENAAADVASVKAVAANDSFFRLSIGSNYDGSATERVPQTFSLRVVPAPVDVTSTQNPTATAAGSILTFAAKNTLNNVPSPLFIGTVTLNNFLYNTLTNPLSGSTSTILKQTGGAAPYDQSYAVQFVTGNGNHERPSGGTAQILAQALKRKIDDFDVITSGAGLVENTAPGSWGTDMPTANPTYIELPAGKYAARLGGRWYAVTNTASPMTTGSFTPAGGTATLEALLETNPTFVSVPVNTQAPYTVLQTFSAPKWDFYRVYDDTTSPLNLPVSPDTAQKNSVFVVPKMVPASSNQVTISATSAPSADVKFYFYTGRLSAAKGNAQWVPDSANSAAQASAVLSTGSKLIGNRWWAYNMNVGNNGVPATYWEKPAGADYTMLSNIGGGLSLTVQWGVQLAVGSQGTADVSSITGLTNNGKYIVHKGGGAALASNWFALNSGAMLVGSAGALTPTLNGGATHILSGSNAITHITNSYTTLPADTYNVYQLYQVNASTTAVGTIPAAAGDSAVTMTNNNNVVVQYAGLSPNQAADYAGKTGIYGFTVGMGTGTPAYPANLIIQTGLSGAHGVTAGNITNNAYDAFGTIANSGLARNDVVNTGAAGTVAIAAVGTNIGEYVVQIGSNANDASPAFSMRVVPAPENISKSFAQKPRKKVATFTVTSPTATNAPGNKFRNTVITTAAGNFTYSPSRTPKSTGTGVSLTYEADKAVFVAPVDQDQNSHDGVNAVQIAAAAFMRKVSDFDFTLDNGGPETVLTPESWGTDVLNLAGNAVESITLPGGKYIVKIGSLWYGITGANTLSPTAGSDKMDGALTQALVAQTSITVAALSAKGTPLYEFWQVIDDTATPQTLGTRNTVVVARTVMGVPTGSAGAGKDIVLPSTIDSETVKVRIYTGGTSAAAGNPNWVPDNQNGAAISSAALVANNQYRVGNKWWAYKLTAGTTTGTMPTISKAVADSYTEFTGLHQRTADLTLNLKWGPHITVGSHGTAAFSAESGANITGRITGLPTSNGGMFIVREGTNWYRIAAGLIKNTGGASNLDDAGAGVLVTPSETATSAFTGQYTASTNAIIGDDANSATDLRAGVYNVYQLVKASAGALPSGTAEATSGRDYYANGDTTVTITNNTVIYYYGQFPQPALARDDGTYPGVPTASSIYYDTVSNSPVRGLIQKTGIYGVKIQTDASTPKTHPIEVIVKTRAAITQGTATTAVPANGWTAATYEYKALYSGTGANLTFGTAANVFPDTANLKRPIISLADITGAGSAAPNWLLAMAAIADGEKQVTFTLGDYTNTAASVFSMMVVPAPEDVAAASTAITANQVRTVTITAPAGYAGGSYGSLKTGAAAASFHYVTVASTTLSVPTPTAGNFTFLGQNYITFVNNNNGSPQAAGVADTTTTKLANYIDAAALKRKVSTFTLQ